MNTTVDWLHASAALADGRWSQSAASFSALADATGDPRAHEGRAQAAWWLDDAETALAAREAAYRGFRAMGDDIGAARAAAALGYDSMLMGGGVAVGRGWLARSADLLGTRTDVREAGWLAVRYAEVALNVDHDAETALSASIRAQDVGRSVGDHELVIVGQSLAGLAQVRLGDVDGGMPLLDAAAAAATAGDVAELMWMGKVCCWLISACHETHDLDRAKEWCERVQEICERRGLAPLFAVCRTLYASVLLGGGRSQEAEGILVDVLARMRRSRRLSRLDAVAQLGELRRRQGRHAEAEELLRQAGYRPAAVTSLAQLHLDQGDPERAWSTVAELLRAIPATQLLDRADALAVGAAAAVASGRVAEAHEYGAELRAIATRVGTSAFLAQAAAAQARLAEGDAVVDAWQDAVRHFHAAGLVFDEADARGELADALRARGDHAAAGGQEAMAGAALAQVRTGTAASPAAVFTERQREVLRLVANGLSNAEIAGRLQLSEHTVHRHIANIYAAAGVSSRAAAAVYAVEHGLR